MNLIDMGGLPVMHKTLDSYSLTECCIDAAPVDFRQAANPAQCGLRIALQADAVHLKAPSCLPG